VPGWRACRRGEHGASGAEAEQALHIAESREDRAKDEARRAHKQAADVNEQRAQDLAAHGDLSGARKAHERADEEREREDHT
jgi:hypothetical protein